MIRSYIRFLQGRAGLIIAALALVTIFFGVGVWKLFGGDLWHLKNLGVRHFKIQVDTSDDRFLAAHDPQLKVYRDSTRVFGDDRYLIALLEFDDVFTPDNLALISKISESAGRLPGARRVSSLTHEPMYLGAGKSFENARLSSRLPKTQSDANAVRTAVLSDSLHVRNLVSQDGRLAAIYVRTWPHVRAAQLDFLVKRFEQTVRLEARRVPAWFAGNHVQTIELHNSTISELKRLLPLSAAVIAVFLLIVLRCWVRVSVLLVLMFMSLLWTFGFLGWIGRPITPLDVILPTLLLTLCTTYALQFISRHLMISESRAAGKDHDRFEECVQTADDTFFSLFLAQITTAIGAASLCFTDIPAIFQFGMLSTIGTLFAAVLIYTALPIAVLVLPLKPRTHAPEAAWMISLARASQSFYRHKKWSLMLAFGLTLVLAAGMFRLNVESDPKSFFKESAPLRVAFRMLEERMGGAVSLSVVVDGGDAGSMKDPWTLQKIANLQSFAESQPHVLKTISFVDTVKRLNHALHAGPHSELSIPSSREEISQLLLLASFGDDPSNFDRYVDYDYRRGRIEIRLENLDSKRALQLAASLQAYMDQNWPAAPSVAGGMSAAPMTGSVTGDFYMSCRANEAILKGQIRGFLGTIVVVFIVMWICLGSPKVGFLALIPNVAPILAVLGLMGYFGVRIDVCTALLASVALGIALDDTIHFIVHYIRSVQKRPQGQMAVREVVHGVGRAMVFTNIALALGFSVLLASSFAPVKLFGAFMIAAMIMACFDDFVMMPGLLAWIPLVGIWEQWRIKFKSDVTRGIPLFSNLAESDIKKIVVMGRLMTVPADWPLMKEGASGEEMFVILDGSVTVSKTGHEVTRLGRGESVGEMGLISDHPRSADVTVNEETTVFAFGYEALERLERRYPRLATRLLHNLAAILSRRLASTTELLK